MIIFPKIKKLYKLIRSSWLNYALGMPQFTNLTVFVKIVQKGGGQGGANPMLKKLQN